MELGPASAPLSASVHRFPSCPHLAAPRIKQTELPPPHPGPLPIPPRGHRFLLPLTPPVGSAGRELPAGRARSPAGPSFYSPAESPARGQGRLQDRLVIPHFTQLEPSGPLQSLFSATVISGAQQSQEDLTQPLHSGSRRAPQRGGAPRSQARALTPPFPAAPSSLLTWFSCLSRMGSSKSEG